MRTGAQRFRMLAGVPDADVQRLLAVARRRRFARGEVVFHRDDPADTLHFITKGRFAVRVMTPLENTVTIAVRGPGDAFGETALLAASPKRTATVSALEPAETFALGEREFARLRQSFPAVDRILFAFLAAELRRQNELLLEALYLPVDRRLRRRLLELARIYGGHRDGEVPIPLTQAQLAEMAGTSRATANQILRAEQQRCTLRLDRGQVVVLDRAELARRAR
jgi:CRP/FNR family transcriptional regulator, cyclic AMP receptor protein